MNKIRKDDQVIVITGKDKGRRGRVLNMMGDRALIEGINLVKKHVKPDPNKGITGGIDSKSMPLHLSNIALIDADGKPSRVGFKIDDGQKVRFLKTTGEIVGG
jgi:large subunit ribosomal protein L24